MTNPYSHLKLKVIPREFKYVSFKNGEALAAAMTQMKNLGKNDPVCLFFTPDDFSLIGPSDLKIQEFEKEEPDWRAIRIIGEMPFGTVQGLIATLTGQLKECSLGACVVSTYKTDYFFVKTKNLTTAIEHFRTKGWEVLT